MKISVEFSSLSQNGIFKMFAIFKINRVQYFHPSDTLIVKCISNWNLNVKEKIEWKFWEEIFSKKKGCSNHQTDTHSSYVKSNVNSIRSKWNERQIENL